MVCHPVKVRQIPRVGELVQVGDAPFGLSARQMVDEVAADETGTAGHENVGGHFPKSLLRPSLGRMGLDALR